MSLPITRTHPIRLVVKMLQILELITKATFHLCLLNVSNLCWGQFDCSAFIKFGQPWPKSSDFFFLHSTAYMLLKSNT